MAVNFLICEADFPKDGGWIGDEPDQEHPAGWELAEFLAASMRTRATRVSDVDSHEGYAAAFGFDFDGAPIYAMVGPYEDFWLITLELNFILPRILRRRHYESLLNGACEYLNGIMQTDKRFSHARWFTEMEWAKFEKNCDIAPSIRYGDIGVQVDNQERNMFLDWFAANRCNDGDSGWEYCKSESQRAIGQSLDLENLVPQGTAMQITSDEHDQAAAEFGPNFARLLGIIESITRGDWKSRADSNAAKNWRRSSRSGWRMGQS